jgi:hypothetical protein
VLVPLAHRIQIFPEKKLIIIQYEGEISYEDLVATGLELKAMPDFSEEFNGVSDFRNAHKNLSIRELKVYADRIQYKKNTSVKWCSLNSTAKETALTIIFKEHLEYIHPFEVFSTIKAASEYLRTDLSPYLQD